MNDRELLEMAAKAAGYPKEWKGAVKIMVDAPIYERDWNPLADDGDALRLLTKMPFRELYVSEIGATVSWSRNEGSGHGFKCDEYSEDHNGDIKAAARRAIVRAAAAIGKAMP